MLQPLLAAPVAPIAQVIDLKGRFRLRSGGTHLDLSQGMKAPQDRLVRHLAIAIAVKLVVLTGIWWSFVRDERVGVDVEKASVHLGDPVAPLPLPPVINGAQP